MLQRLVLTCLLVVLFALSGRATHIVGGELSYEHISGDNYRVTLKLFRDCGPGNAAFPGLVRMRAFYNLGNDYVEVGLSPSSITLVPPVVDTCVIQPDICVEQAIYTDIFALPHVDGGYHIMFDTGNRNASIDNIASPLSAGEGFYVRFPDSLFEQSTQFDTLYYENFALANGTTIDTGPTEWTSTGSGSGTAQVQGGAFEGNDLGQQNAFWYSDTIDISGYPGGVSVTLDLYESGNLENQDTARCTYSVDFGPHQEFTIDGLLFNDFTTATPTTNNIVGNQLIVRVQLNNSSASETIGFDNVLIYETPEVDTLVVNINSSPTFNNFPPIFLCVNEPFTFDHAATDDDGDSLAYYLCTPYEAWNSSPFSTNSVGPPPFGTDGLPILDSITWLAGYSQNNPLGSGPFTIDEITGQLTGTPAMVGQFVVGVCVDEFRDGHLVSTNKRDFQFNTLVCPKPVEAIIDTVPINVCDGDVLNFPNLSDDQFINTWDWDFGDLTATDDSSDVQFPNYLYPDTGVYMATLIANRGSACSDSDTAVVNVVWIDAAFTTNPLGCDGMAHTFTENVVGHSALNITDYDWDFGDGNTASGASVMHTYGGPGTYTVTLTATSASGCASSTTQDVIIQQQPTANGGGDQLLCAGAEEVVLAGSVTQALGGAWTGGTGTYIPDADSVYTIYQPTNAEKLAGSLEFVLTTTGVGCTPTTDTIEVTWQGVLATETSNTLTSCPGVCDGTSAVTPQQGVPPYTFLWDDPMMQTDSLATGLCEGTHTVIVSDALVCKDTVEILISPPFVIEANLDSTDITCTGLTDGTATANPVNGTAPYTYQWNDGPTSTTQSINVLAPGFYVVTITDNVGCFSVDSIEVNDPGDLLVPGTAKDACDGFCNGEAAVTPAQSNPPYSYAWDAAAGNSTDSLVVGLCSGTYKVTVTDSKGCVDSAQVTVSNPPGITMTKDSLGLGCSMVCTGEAVVTPAGGALPYSYLWSDPLMQTDSLATGLCKGVYTVTVTYGQGCTDSTTVEVIEPQPLALDSSVVEACQGLCNGEATVNATGGTMPYTYLWGASAGGQTTAQATNLCATLHRAYVTDVRGCNDSIDVEVGTLAAVVLTMDSADASCYGACDGTATISPGTPGTYTYLWNDAMNQTTPTATGLCAGNYCVTMTFANGCDVVRCVDVVEPDSLIGDVSPAPVSCGGECDGSALVVPSGGTAPYTYLWSDPDNSTASLIFDLCAGLYTVSITDANNCMATDTGTVGSPQTLEATIDVLTDYNGQDISCFGASDANIGIVPSGGVPAYTYQWDAGTGSQQGTQASNLPAGTYTITITDGNGCDTIYDITVTQPALLTVNATVTSNYNGRHQSCFMANDAEATAVPAGGTAPYTYIWAASTGSQTTPTATGLGAGNHNIVIRDANNCGTVGVPNVFQTPLLDPAIAVTSDYNGQDISCNGASDGQATVTVLGGTGARTYTWDVGAGSQTTATATGLSAGTYTVTVQDANSCDTVVSITLTEPPATNVTASATTNYNGNNISCAGAGDGGVAVVASGGYGSLSVQWSANAGSATTNTVNGLDGGWYYVSVTDSNACVTVDSVFLQEPDSLGGPLAVTSNYNGADVSCNGATDGIATLTTSGGTPTYTYQWDAGTGGQTGTTATGLGAGTYTISITDANGCDTALSVTVTEPAALGVAMSITSNYNGRRVSCFQAADGTALASPSGGTTPYTYVWAASTGGQNTPTATGLSAGTYSCVVRDANNCVTVGIANVFQTPQLLPTIAVTSNYNGEDVSCVGANDGSAQAGISGGTSPYTYAWDAGAGNQTTATATGLTAGTFSVTISDVNGCDTVVSVTLSDPPALAANAGVTTNYNGSGVSCNGASDGAVLANATGGVGGYTYSWTTGASTAAVAGLSAAVYTVTVTDNNNCTATDMATLTEPAVLSGTTSVTTNYNGFDVSCNGDADGAVSVAAAGGTAAYTYSWNTGASGTNVSSLAAGTYTVTIEDANGCDTVYSITVNEPPALDAPASVTSNYNGRHLSCFGASDGEATAVPVGGVAPYTYVWAASTGGQTTATATGLSAGSYSVVVRDQNNCVDVTVVTVFQTPQLLPTIAVTSNYNGEDISCTGASDGVAQAGISGGTAPYTYAWDAAAGNQATASATGLAAGTYSVNIADANGCDTVVSITLSDPAPLLANAGVTTNYNGVGVSCNGATDGAVLSAATGGVAAYTYSWSSGAATGPVAGLAAGVYTVTVTDANNCTATDNATLTEPTILTATPSVTTDYNGFDVRCNGGSDGAVAVAASGGTPNYVYSWSTGAMGANVSSLSAGTYTVTATDANGCDTVYSIALNQPPAVAANASVTSNYNGRHLSCFGASDGEATAVPSGGVTPYTYQWAASTGGQTTATATGLSAGNYTVVVRDANNCPNLALVNVNQTPALNTTVAATNVSVSCAGVCDGSAVASPTGGTGAYSYAWSNGDNTNTATNLCPGVTDVTVTDANACTTLGVTVIAEPSTMTVTVIDSSDVLCFGGSDGMAEVVAAGGTPIYTYVWNNGASGTQTTTLSAGVAAVTVTDNNGCVASTFTIINEPDLLEATTAVVSDYGGRDISCFGESDGIASVTPVGGTVPYTYQWDAAAANQTDSVATGLAAGTYLVTVVDANACDTVVAVTLTEPAPIVPVTSVTSNYNGADISCTGAADGAVFVSTAGGTAPYDVLWDAGAGAATDSAVAGLIAGTYSVLVADSNGCDSAVTVTLSDPPLLTGATAITTNYNGTDVSCFGVADGGASATPTGGTGSISYLWDAAAANQTDSIATGLAAGTYSVTLTDVNMCDTVVSITVVEPPVLVSDSAIESNYNGQDVSCFGVADGSTSVTPSGGTGAYTYLWDATASGQTDSIATGLAAGQYTVVITDANGCDTTISITVTEPAVLESATAVASNYNGQDVSCFGLSDGAVSATPAGGTLPWTYLWDAAAASQTDSLATGLPAGTYAVTVSDANACDTVVSVIVTEPVLVEATTSVTSNYSGQDISCFGLSDGAVAVVPSGGTTPFTYGWDSLAGFATDSTVTGLAAATYSVTVTDVNGCDTVVHVTVTEPALLAASTAVTTNYAGADISCFGVADGGVSVTPAGGTPSYTYLWDAGAGNSTDTTVNSLPSGVYAVTVSDANACDTVVSITLVDPLVLVADSAVESNYNGQDVSCFGRADGAASVTPAGGTGAYTYAWDAGANNQTDSLATALAAGQYTVVISDVNGCDTTISITLTEPDLLEAATSVTSNYNGQDVSCFGLTDGSVEATPMGGTLPWTYQWDSLAAFQTTPAATGLGAGTYSVTVTDVNGCDTLVNVTVTEPPLLGAAASVSTNYNGQDISCFGLSDGAVEVLPSGGTLPLTYLWDTQTGSATDSTVSGLPAATYSVTVTDVNGCDTITNVTVTEPPLLEAATAVTTNYAGANISCFGASDGGISVTPTGGTPSYTYVWDAGAGSSTDTLVTGLPSGSYLVTLSDANSCDTVVAVTLADPALLVASTLVVSNYNGQDVTCFGASDGEASVTPAGGTGAYTYLWGASAAAQTDSLATGLAAGTHTVVVTDTNGCDTVVDVALQNPPLLTVGTSVFSNYNGQDISCFGLSDGMAGAFPAGGTFPYTYQWDAQANNQTNSLAVGLAAGTYSVTVADVNGCTVDSNIVLTHPALLAGSIGVATSYNGQDVSCFGAADGEADMQPVGGTTPYTYQWDAGTGSQTDSLATGLVAGTYTVTVTDVNTCDTVFIVSLSEPPPLVLTYDSLNPSCFGFCNGWASVTAAGGTQPYTYLWDDPLGQTDSLATGLCTGTVSVTVTDANGCAETLSVLLQEPAVLGVAFDSTNVTCAGFCNGWASATPSGGSGAYTYLWSDGLAQTDSLATGLCPDTYILTLSDSLGCVLVDSMTISEPQPLSLVKDSTNVSCFGYCDAWVSVAVAGGTRPYTYFWSNGAPQTDTLVQSLCAGVISMSLIDSLGCIIQTNFNVQQPGAIALSIAVDSVQCYEACDGQATVSVTGGSAPFTYQWNDGLAQTTATAIGLCDDRYRVTVSDVNGCVFTDSAVVFQPDTLMAMVAGTHISCNGLCDGMATVTGTGGTLPYTYEWDDPAVQTTQTATGLCAGQVWALLTDANGCTAPAPTVLTEPQPLLGSLSLQHVSCFGLCDALADASISGGTLPYTYAWNDGQSQTTQTATGLCAGGYAVTVSDSNGCVLVLTDTITQPAPLEAVIVNTDSVSCFGLSNGAAQAGGLGGTAPYSYVWGDAQGQTLATATGLAEGIYSVTVSDFYGCTSTETASILQPGPLNMQMSGTENICLGSSTTISASAFGGVAPYTYVWDQGLGVGQQHLVSPTGNTTYIATVTDAAGCVGPIGAVNIFVLGFAQASLQATALDTVVCPDAGTILQASVTGSAGPFSYTWSHGLGDGPGPIPVIPGGDVTYYVTVTDDCGNTDVDSVQIVEEVPLQFTLPNQLADGCAPLLVNLIGQAPNVPNATYIWDMDNGDSLFTQDPVYTYNELGYYNINLTVISEQGCVYAADNTGFVEVSLGPDATFSSSAGTVTMAEPTVDFGAVEPFAESYSWAVEGDSVGGNTQQLAYTFTDTGTFVVQLAVTTNAGCTDTSTRTVTVEPFYRFEVPTAFTPNTAGPNGGVVDYNALHNDVFFPVTTPEFILEYEMQIFNRWGEIVFESTDANIGWDGYYKGELAPGAVYMVKIRAEFFDGRRRLYHGNVTLLR